MDDAAAATSRPPAGSSADAALASDVAGLKLDSSTAIKTISVEEGGAVAAAVMPMGGAQQPQPQPQLRKKIVWECGTCQRACFPIRLESRCLCNHRYRQHPASGDFACAEKGCKCRRFFYIFAEGAFILRCRCKHKAQEHDAGAAPYACARAGCKCAAFDSPWVCNCDHAWANHSQRVVEVDLNAPLPASSLAPWNEFQVLRTDIVNDPLPRYGGGGGSIPR